MSRIRLIQVIMLAATAGTLEILCRTGVVNRLTLIPPSEMVLSIGTIASSTDWFWPDILYTLRNLAAATAIAVLCGFVLGLAVHALPRLRRVLNPLFSSYYAVPTFVLYPLIIVFFGIGPMSLIVMGALTGIVAMMIATMTAIDRIPRVLFKVGRVTHLGPLRSALLLKLPAAAPHLFTGLKLAVAYCVIGVIAGEFILASAGIGRRIALSYNEFDNRTMYAIVVLIITFVAVLNAFLGAWERRIHRRWYRS